MIITNSFQKQSFVHKLNPTLKFIAFIFIICMIFLPLGFFAQAILLVILLSLFLSAKIGKKVLWNIFKSVCFLFIILLVINWFLYKLPIAINVNDWSQFTGRNGILLGSVDWINSPFLAFNQNSLIISEIWGGEVGINGSSFIPFDNLLINNIIAANNISTETLDKFWNGANAETKRIFELAFNDLEVQKKYYWLMNNEWSYNQLNYQAIGVSIPNFAGLESISTQEEARTFLMQSYYVTATQWYTLSPEAIQLALYVSLKVFLMILVATLLTSTTNSIQLTYALENLLSPLKLFKLPVAEASMMIAIALRFIPSLLAESNKIMNAQASRGIDFSNGGFIDKMKSLSSLVVPLFSIAFKKAEELANAMDARAYNARYARTKYRRYNVAWFDWLAFFGLMLLFGFFVGISKWKLFFTPFNLFELGIIL